MANVKEYALYKGEEILGIGTIKEIAEELNVLPTTIKYYGTNAYRNKLAKRKKSKNIRELVLLDETT
ncbi:MAG TPA: hypothetical protein DDZ33_02455 [Clostridium sp.]|nr:hypothetical protein [Clostridium sp.]